MSGAGGLRPPRRIPESSWWAARAAWPAAHPSHGRRRHRYSTLSCALSAPSPWPHFRPPPRSRRGCDGPPLASGRLVRQHPVHSALVRQDRAGLCGQAEVLDLPVDAVRRHAASSVRTGQGPHGRRHLDAARPHRRPLPAYGVPRAAVHDAEPGRRGDQQGAVGLPPAARHGRVQGRAPDRLPSSRPRRLPHRNKPIKAIDDPKGASAP